MELYTHKTANFSSALLYSEEETTFLHSLEAFVGLIDFDSLQQHCSEGVGILGSPAATAAYLLNCTKWDSRAETYLRNASAVHGNSGGVPSAFPTCIFELSWVRRCAGVITVFPTNRFFCMKPPADIPVLGSFNPAFAEHPFELRSQRAHKGSLVILSGHSPSKKGLVGFAVGVLADADDTARTLLALSRLGTNIDPRPLIDKFQSNKHFKTYSPERNSSFSANCNVLLCLLET